MCSRCDVLAGTMLRMPGLFRRKLSLAAAASATPQRRDLRPLQAAANAVKWANALRDAIPERLPDMEPAYHPLATDKSTPLDCDETAGLPRRHAAFVLRLPVSMLSTASCSVILREHSRQVLDEAVKHLAMLPVPGPEQWRTPWLLVTGSPGIGKSAGFLPGLVRRLLLGHASPMPSTIVIEDRIRKKVIKLRSNSSGVVTDANVIDIQDFRPASDPELFSPSTVYVVDATSRGGGDRRSGSPAKVEARTVVIAPPDDDHFKDFLKRRPAPLVLYMQPWSLDELRAARLLCQPDVSATDAAVIERWLQQGGNPRIAYATPEVVLEANQRSNNAVVNVSERVLGNLVFGTRKIRLEEKGNNGATSAIIAYQSEPPFMRPKTVFISDAVRDLVI